MSDEITAMLGVARAHDFASFRQALATFSLPGQNMTYADAAGNIGKVYAVHVPDRKGAMPADLVVSPQAADRIWAKTYTALDLPARCNPPAGFIASANNRPESEVGVGHLFSPEDRAQRMATVVTTRGRLDIGAVMAVQRDVFVASSLALRDAILAKIETAGLRASLAGAEAMLIAELTD
jgi:penicillin amidase